MESDWATRSLTEDPSAIAIAQIPASTPWETIRIHHASHAPAQLLGVFPSHLQIDTRFYRAVRELGMSSLIVPIEQMQAGIALVKPLSIGGIVTTAAGLHQCAAALREHSPEAEPYFQVVLAPEDAIPESVLYRTYHEIHLIPGVPVLYQCAFIPDTALFHPTAAFDARSYPAPLADEPILCGCAAPITLRRA